MKKSLRLADVVFDRDFPNHQQQLQCKDFHAKYLCRHHGSHGCF